MNLKKTLIIAVLLSAIILGSWEIYWRSQGVVPGLEDDKELWALQRAKVETATDKDVVLVGSSRVLFDMQLNEWEALTGHRPIQLASAGTTPLPAFHDIVRNTNYNGTVVVGVTPGLFFSTTYPMAPPWIRIQSRIDYYEDRTYAQILNHKIAVPLQNSFAFLTSDDEEWTDDLNLKSLIARIKLGERIGPRQPPFYRFQDIYSDRNVMMKQRTVTDTAFANSIIKVWGYFIGGSPPPDKEATMKFFLDDLAIFKERGGRVILARCPSSGGLRIGEGKGLTRQNFWDDLVQKANVPGYHFEDYEQLKNFECPEWSHLSAADARSFTTEFVKIAQKEGNLTNNKNN